MEWDSLDKAPEKAVLTKSESIMAAWTAEAMMIPQKQIKKAEYRSSSMPLCGHYLELMDGKEIEHPGSMGFYTAIGTAIHELLQDRFPYTKNGASVFANWLCEPCEEEYKEQCFPGPCPQCGGKLKYKEIDFIYKGLLTGHVDLLLRLKSGVFWLLDWKTTSIWALENPSFVGLPYPKNRAQIESYPVALKEEKGIVVEKVFLDYLQRAEPEDDILKPKNRPFEIIMTPEIYAARKAQMDRVVAEKRAFEAFKAQRTLDNLKRFDHLRPCHNLREYADKRYGQAPYFQYIEGGCPFANDKGCFTKGLSEPAKLLAKKIKGS